MRAWAAEPEARVSYENSHTLPALHHAVGMSLPDDWADPKGLPLGDQRTVECKTCHGLKNMERTPYPEVDKKAAGFLRGGPYASLDAFCVRCHDRDELERPNIHIMRNEAGQLLEDHCTYCHDGVPSDRDQPHRAVDYRLRLPPEKICYGCHLKTPHFNALEHQDAKPDEAMRRHIRASERQLNIRLPLSNEGRVMCPTCHSPHQYGVIDAHKNPAGQSLQPADLKKGVEYREHPWNAVIQADKDSRLRALNRERHTEFQLDYRRINQEVLLRTQARDGALCLACHTFRD
ncbi:MAG: hypothetical protein ACR2HF_07615 [Methylococcaceae bacterium]